MKHPPPLTGTLSQVFAVGPRGAEWLERVRRSAWYSALRPRAVDVGDRRMPQTWWTKLKDGEQLVGQIAEPVADVDVIPDVPLATVAVMDGITAQEAEVTVALVRALTHGVRAGTRRPVVAVTVGGDEVGRPELIATLERLGAFVIRQAGTIEADHFHHFPVRAVTRPPGGQMVGVDAADYLDCWTPGRIADMHVIPFGSERTEECVLGIAVPENLAAVNLNIHIPVAGPGSTLAAIDRMATLCREALLGEKPGLPMIFTTRERLDGMTDSADLLLIREDGG